MFNSINRLDRIKKINRLIKKEQTGNPVVFARALNVGRRQLYNVLEDFKIMGASVKYCRRRETFYYQNEFDLEIKYSIKIIKNGKIVKIYENN